MSEIEDMGIKELLEQGIQSEINSQNVYKSVAKERHSYSLSGKLRFLIEEEREHEKTLRRFFKERFPDETPDIPQEVLKPAPDVDVESDSLGELLEEAMESEKESMDFYEELADRFEDEDKQQLARYLANMEEGHYQLLEHELETMKKFGPKWGDIRAF